MNTLKETFVSEIWVDIVGFEGKYQISNLGRVKSFPKFIKRKVGSYYTKEKLLKCTLDNYGYEVVNLYTDGKMIHTKIHRLVAEHFISNQFNDNDVNHINGIKTDNRVENLEWCNRSHNIQHSYDNFLHNAGENCNLSKLTWDKVNFIREHYKANDKQFGQKALAIMFNVNQCTIWHIVTNKTWKHKTR